jgi:hypothetical protein
MARDRGSPIEWTGRAHIVTVTCPLCDESHSVAETTADDYDGDVPCSDCTQRFEQLERDLFGYSQAERVRLLADYMEARGYITKSNILRSAADRLALIEPIVRGIDSWRSGDFAQNREGLEKSILEYE